MIPINLRHESMRVRLRRLLSQPVSIFTTKTYCSTSLYCVVFKQSHNHRVLVYPARHIW